jgi:predicted PurR-regulated permease PerM
MKATSPDITDVDTEAFTSAADSVLSADSTPSTPPQPRHIPITLGVGILAVIAITAALYLARAFFVPLLIGILASYTLHPVVDWLHARHIPRAVGAALVLLSLMVGAVWAAFSLGGDATDMIEKLPEAARKVRQQVITAQEGGPTALQKIQEAATELQRAAADAASEKKPAEPAIKIRESEPSVWLRDYLLTQSALLFTVAAQTPIVVLLTYFLLASGAHFRRKLVQLVGPSLSRKKDAVRILDEIDVQIQRYLVAMLGSNVLVALFTWLGLSAMGMEQAGVWGITAGILHFIPYLGPVLFAIISGMAAFMQFGTALQALSIAGVSLLVATAVGSLFMTWLQSRFARVNATVLFIALLFFAWMWGIWGLLLGGPLVAIAKVICDRVESLRLLGELLGK